MNERQFNGIGLGAARRDSRVTAGSRRLNRMPPPRVAAAEGARAVVARHATRRSPRPRPALIFGKTRPPVTFRGVHNNIHNSINLHHAPRLALTLLSRPEVSTWEPARRAGADGARPAAPGSVLSRKWPQPINPHPGGEQVVRRLAARRERIEAAVRITAPGEAAPVTRPAGRVVRRNSFSAGARAVVPQTPDGVRAAPRALSRTEGATHGRPDFGQHDIEGLTDRVIRAIDSRIIAQRERMGRA